MGTSSKSLEKFEHFYASDQFIEAQKMLETLLIKSPDNHWLWTRLSSVLYEQKKYNDAFRASKKALRLCPCCPLVKWDYAGVLRVLDRSDESADIYENLLSTDTTDLAFGDCGEGLRWAKSLQNDCRYCLALIFVGKKSYKKAAGFIKAHLTERQRGQYSCFSKKDALKLLEKCSKNTRKGKGVP